MRRSNPKNSPQLANSSKKISYSKFESNLNRMSKWLIISLFGLNILYKHDITSLWATMGISINSFLSIKLKKAINHRRPENASKSDPGMPSSHAQNLFYGVVFANLSLVHFHGINFITITLGSLILLFGSYLAWLRISQRLHTMDQVTVGAILGSIFGFVWFHFWHSFLFNSCISYFWVRILVLSSSVSSSGAFFYYIVLKWF